MLIFVENKTPRIIYITDFVIRQLLGYELVVTDDVHFFEKNKTIKINYSLEIKKDSDFFLPPHTLLFQTNIQQQDTNITNFFDLPCLFEVSNSNADFPFDVFAAAFWILTRYEEYLSEQRDNHGRFRATSSLAYRKDFLHLPIIQLWVNQFSLALESKFQKISKAQPKSFKFIPSYDIDMAWAYRQKGIIRTVGGVLQDLRKGRFTEVYNRLLVLSKQKKDPFDSFDFLENLNQKHNISPIFFFLLGDFDKFDKNTNYKNKNLILLVQEIHQKYKIGIHPSYASNEKPLQVKIEVNRLSEIIQNDVVDSRQHFLKLTFPDTYQRLIESGIKNDYSMGYAANIGFRAGVSIPFLWYNLEKEEITDLWIHPFQVMDVTLKNYLKLNPNEAFMQIVEMINIIKSVGGTFMTLWHNSSFSEQDSWNAEWKELYERIIAEAVKRD
ncbi:MAG: hypothetical protein ACI85O_002036 [Saprospiraceae bacterium]|jgi:hypothetical protein